MRLFVLHRDEDVSGMSGIGIIAEGCIFDDKRCVLRWLTKTASTGFYDSIEQLELIHGHQGRTRIVYIPYFTVIEGNGFATHWDSKDAWEIVDNESWEP